jgi:HD-GYP domain-containing protein (c-di-GMP phosphodiesterase class II)
MMGPLRDSAFARHDDAQENQTDGDALAQGGRLARTLGVKDRDLIHITRGALLHDIGKMGIPDGILLKPGKLTEEERALIQKHPAYAYEMLNPIEFLHPAMDIPYCHHEKWDGTGYPRGLKGEEIPFAARIFPIVDVWDALISDRPYRKGLPREEVLQRLQADSGRHFDPQVVDAFMEMGDYAV